MLPIIILLTVALVISLAFNFGFFNKSATPAISAGTGTSPAPRIERGDESVADRAARAEAELDKKRKELEDAKRATNELKDELKAAKKKLFDQKESNKGDDDLVKARAETERQASIQLDNTRHELAAALAEVAKLKGLLESKAKKPREERPVERTEEPKKEVVIQKVIRELSDAEKEKMNRLEQQSSQDKKKAIELAAELRSLKAKIDREKREAKRIYEEGRLARDKFRAVEIRLNRTLLEADMLKRALLDLEKKTGQHAERTALTADEIAASDQRMKDKYAAEDKAAEEAQKKLEAAEAKAEEAAAAAAAAPAPAAPAPAAEPAPAAPAPEAAPTGQPTA